MCSRNTKIKTQIGTLKRAKRAEQRGKKRRETADENLSKRQRIDTHLSVDGNSSKIKRRSIIMYNSR